MHQCLARTSSQMILNKLLQEEWEKAGSAYPLPNRATAPMVLITPPGTAGSRSHPSFSSFPLLLNCVLVSKHIPTPKWGCRRPTRVPVTKGNGEDVNEGQNRFKGGTYFNKLRDASQKESNYSEKSSHKTSPQWFISNFKVDLWFTCINTDSSEPLSQRGFEILKFLFLDRKKCCP